MHVLESAVDATRSSCGVALWCVIVRTLLRDAGMIVLCHYVRRYVRKLSGTP